MSIGGTGEAFLALGEQLGRLASALLGGSLLEVRVELWGVEEEVRIPTTVAAVRHTSAGVIDNKKPLQLQGLRYYSRRVKPAIVINTYGSSPDASIRASSIAPGEHIMLMKVAPVSLATIGRCGQLMAMRKRANSA